MTRRMRDPEFAAGQLRELYAPHVKPINKLVDELRVDRDRWLPHVAPQHDGVLATLLWFGSDPGPAPADPYAALIGVENDDAGSARVGALLKRAGIDPARTLPWNASPWYTDRPDVRAGLEPLRRLLELMGDLEVVVLLGRVAERSWRMLASTHPDDVPSISVLTTTEADDAGFEGTNAQRHQRREEQALVFEEAGRLLRESL